MGDPDERDDVTRIGTGIVGAGTAPPGDADATMYVPRDQGSVPHPEGGGDSGTALPPGSMLDHTHQIEAFIAAGGMGEVYRGRNLARGRTLAIKIIRPQLASDPKVRDLFENEGEALSRIFDDAIVRYEGTFFDSRGRLFIAMEFVDGVSLATFTKQRALSADEVLALRDRLANGLAVAHDHRVYHRDISPDNVILAGEKLENAKIIDFGIAKLADPAAVTVLGGDFAGKYSYSSPEQLGMYGGQVDGRSDIYSLGLVLAAAARGEPIPMGDSPIGVIEARQRVPDLSGLPESLRAEIAPMLEPDPANRPQTMRALIRRAESQPFFLDAAPASAKPATAAPSPRVAPAAAPTPAPGRNKTPLFVGAGAAVLLVLGAGGYFLFGQHQNAPPASAPLSFVSPAQPPPAAVQPAVAPTALPAKPAIDRPALQNALDATLTGYDCANLRAAAADDGSVRVDGFVSNPNDLSRLGAKLAGIPQATKIDNRANVYAWPFCETIRMLLLVDAGASLNGSVSIEPDRADGTYRAGDPFSVRVTPQQSGYLYVDILDSGGNVIHATPHQGKTDNATNAGQTVTLGGQAYSIGPPFGSMMVSAFVLPKPLGPARPEVETAEAYFPWLRKRLDALQGQGVKANASYDFVTTLPK